MNTPNPGTPALTDPEVEAWCNNEDKWFASHPDRRFHMVVASAWLTHKLSRVPSRAAVASIFSTPDGMIYFPVDPQICPGFVLAIGCSKKGSQRYFNCLIIGGAVPVDELPDDADQEEYCSTIFGIASQAMSVGMAPFDLLKHASIFVTRKCAPTQSPHV